MIRRGAAGRLPTADSSLRLASWSVMAVGVGATLAGGSAAADQTQLLPLLCLATFFVLLLVRPGKT